MNGIPTIKVSFERGRAGGHRAQTIVFSCQEGKWKKIKPAHTENNSSNQGEDIYSFSSEEKYLIIKTVFKDNSKYFSEIYYLNLLIEEEKKNLRTLKRDLRLKI